MSVRTFDKIQQDHKSVNDSLAPDGDGQNEQSNYDQSISNSSVSCYHLNLILTKMIKCYICGSAVLCDHRGERYKCSDCGKRVLCEHRNNASKCRDCFPEKCPHGGLLNRCVDCYSNSDEHVVPEFGDEKLVGQRKRRLRLPGIDHSVLNQGQSVWNEPSFRAKQFQLLVPQIHVRSDTDLSLFVVLKEEMGHRNKRLQMINLESSDPEENQDMQKVPNFIHNQVQVVGDVVPQIHHLDPQSDNDPQTHHLSFESHHQDIVPQFNHEIMSSQESSQTAGSQNLFSSNSVTHHSQSDQSTVVDTQPRQPQLSIRSALRENERAVQELNKLNDGIYVLNAAFEGFEQRLDRAKANSKFRGGALLNFDEIYGLAGLLMLSN